MRIATSSKLLLIVCSMLCFAVQAGAQSAPPMPALPLAPVPPALLNAKTVFISNAGADSGLFPHPFSGDPDRPYNEFYGAVQAWGRYQIVGDPSEADIVFELHLLAPNGPSNPNKQNGASDPLPMFRLTVFDRKTHYVLWTLTESISFAFLQKTHDTNFDLALNAITADLKRVTSAPATSAANHGIRDRVSDSRIDDSNQGPQSGSRAAALHRASAELLERDADLF